MAKKKKQRYVVIIEEYDKEHFCWTKKKRITFEKACEMLAKEITNDG